ncbi:hypothetical protein HDU86_004904 [Geranomyces michiganensis]|nr:hypothetical protein HDU86_004904 [Geranomyces michiganensis]
MTTAAVVNCVCAQRSSSSSSHHPRGGIISAYRTFSIYTDAATSSLADLRALVAARVGVEFSTTSSASAVPMLGVFRIDEDLAPHDLRLLHAERNPRHLFRLTELPPDDKKGLLRVWVPRIGDTSALHILVTVSESKASAASLLNERSEHERSESFRERSESSFHERSKPSHERSESSFHERSKPFHERSESFGLWRGAGDGGLGGEQLAWPVSPASPASPSPSPSSSYSSSLSESAPLISPPPRAASSSAAAARRLPKGLLWSPTEEDEDDQGEDDQYDYVARRPPRDLQYSPPRINTIMSAATATAAAATRTPTQRSSIGYYDIADAYYASLARSATTNTSMTTIIPNRSGGGGGDDNAPCVSKKQTEQNNDEQRRPFSVSTNPFRAAKHERSVVKSIKSARSVKTDRSVSIATTTTTTNTNQFRSAKKMAPAAASPSSMASFPSLSSSSRVVALSRLPKDASTWARFVAFVRTRRGKVVISMMISAVLLVVVVKTMLVLGTVKKPAGQSSSTPSPSDLAAGGSRQVTPAAPVAFPPMTAPAAAAAAAAATPAVPSPLSSPSPPATTTSSSAPPAAWQTLTGLQFIGSFTSPPSTTTTTTTTNNIKTLAGCASACVATASLTGCIAAQLVDNNTNCLLMSAFSGVATQNAGASIAFPPMSAASFAAWSAAGAAASAAAASSIDGGGGGGDSLVDYATMGGVCPLATSAAQCVSLCALVPSCAGVTFAAAAAADGAAACCFKSNSSSSSSSTGAATGAENVTLFKRP